MKTYDTLIKLSKRALDELRREMTAMENEKAQLQQAQARLAKELRDEIEQAGRQPEMSGFFGGFAKRIQAKQNVLAEGLKLLEKKMDALRDKIAEAFADLKKYEIAKENAKQRAAEEQNRKDTLLLDEIAGQQFAKKQNADS